MKTALESQAQPEPCECGGRPGVKFSAHDLTWRVHCPGCDKAGELSDTLRDAVESWNSQFLVAH